MRCHADFLDAQDISPAAEPRAIAKAHPGRHLPTGNRRRGSPALEIQPEHVAVQDAGSTRVNERIISRLRCRVRCAKTTQRGK
jgi:hypothetical protein